ncbi:MULTISPECIES: helix-turn-helix transcriptional regulator [unclassified Streptomyces]|uniref:helix-turn-helix domain-containing protein n=1 Tax=unclassified Streptomyces TaxID=2593676 RepID=UPI0004775B85|nr:MULTISPECIES: helix-turn-helix transcriptional regulator [unclassified Streptomyces]MYT31061.1 transcriptional regulator [Streptomyces sp. SID8354]
MPAALVPIELPEWAWQRPEVREALRKREMGAVFRRVQQYGGVSQTRIATAVAMTQARVNEVINGRREITRLDVFERIADGLNMPDGARHLLGLAAARDAASGGRAFDLAAFPEVVRVYATQASASEDIKQLAMSARRLDILAVRGLGLVGLNDSLLRSSLARPEGQQAPQVRVLLLDPESPALAVRAAEIGESAESLAGGVKLAEARLRELSSVCDLRVYRYRMQPTWRVIRLDGTMFVSAFDAGWEGHESAIYKVMEAPQGPLYRGFRRMFEAMVETGIRTI